MPHDLPPWAAVYQQAQRWLAWGCFEAQLVAQLGGVEAATLGQTFDRRLMARAGLVLRRSFNVRRLRNLVAGADVILARNLEMCVIAEVARIATRSQARLVYECLDIHKTVQENDITAKLLRGVERWILSRSAALVLSSPAYISEYYRRFFAAVLPRIILSENKRFEPGAERPALRPRPGPPWQIGWFAKCQCEWSFHLLLDLARRLPDLVEIKIRGRPAAPVMQLIERYLPLPNMQFEGPYTQPQLGMIYGGYILSGRLTSMAVSNPTGYCLTVRSRNIVGTRWGMLLPPTVTCLKV